MSIRRMKPRIVVSLAALLWIQRVQPESLSIEEIRPRDYDKLLPPKLLQGDVNAPVNISVSLYVLQLRSVDEQEMNFKMDCFLHLRWTDSRLIFPARLPESKMVLDGFWGDEIWTPKLWFKNALDTKLQKWVGTTTFYWLMRNKTICFSGRVTMELSCDMDMKNFPHDVQFCGLSIIALMNPTSDLVLNWRYPESIRMSRLMNLPQFEVGNMSISRCDTHLYGEMFSCVQGIFALTRRCGYFIINTYIPTVLIVLMSMLTFWIPPEAVPARITMGVTSLLTMITKQYQSQMPNVSYIVALNIWLSSCIAFVFFSLLEYAIVISLLKKRDEKKRQRSSNSASSRERKLHKSAWNPEVSKYNMTPHFIDLVSRFLFPFSFSIFCVVYGIIYGT